MRSEGKINRIVLTLFLSACYLFFDDGFLHAQTADRIERLLTQNSVNYKDAALLALQAAGRIDADGNTSAEEAFNVAMERGWLPKGIEADHTVRLGGLSLIVMKSFDIKGGAFYSLFKNQHYAYRALVYKGIVHGRVDPQMIVSGDLLLYMVNRAMSKEEFYHE
jgi:hypothetical protein